jgi:hypothetical protein
MTKETKFHKSDMMKNKKKYDYNSFYAEEEILSLKEIKRSKEHKQYRNYENALRSKNVDRLLAYEDD